MHLGQVLERTQPKRRLCISPHPHPTKKRPLADRWRLTFNPDGRHLGEGGGSLSKTRTYDLAVNSRSLYQLSYQGLRGKHSLGRAQVKHLSCLFLGGMGVSALVWVWLEGDWGLFVGWGVVSIGGWENWRLWGAWRRVLRGGCIWVMLGRFWRLGGVLGGQVGGWF